MLSKPAQVYEFGDVVLVPFPYSNQTAHKQRPAVVISSSRYNLARPDAVLMAVTSQLTTTLSSGDTRIAEWQLAGLLKPSAMKPLINTMEQTLILLKLGALQPLDVAALRIAIASILG